MTPTAVRQLVYDIIGELIPTIARSTMEKTERQNARAFMSPGTIVGTSDVVGGVLPYVSVMIDEDAVLGGQAITIPSLASGPLPAGARVMVQFTPPHGAVVLESIGHTLVPYGSISNHCHGGGE